MNTPMHPDIVDQYDILDFLDEWMISAPGEFNKSWIIKELGWQNAPAEYIAKYNQWITHWLELKVKGGMIQRVGDKRGWYRYADGDLEEMDIINASGEPVDIWLPLNLSDYVRLFPGNISVFAGSKDAGKSTFLLNIAKENRHKEWDIHYYSSEMGSHEMKTRLELWPEMTAENWYKFENFHCYERAGRFEDVIPSGPDKLILIDFLECHGDFFKMGGMMKRIHDKLDGAICIIAIQKNKGQEFGLGGQRSVEVSRLYVGMDFGKAHIVSAKNFRDPARNPRGFDCRYKIHNGYNIEMVDTWHQGGDEE